MATAATFTASGSKSAKGTTLPKEVFAVPVDSHELLHSTYVALRSTARTNNAVVKNRAAVSGGGRKPWRQKGTGRARVGSIRSPIWRGGGVTFGPSGKENYRKRLNKAAKRKATTQALSLKAEAKKVIVIEDVKTDGTVKSVMNVLTKLPVSGRVLIVTDNITADISRATRNIQNVSLTQSTYLNAVKILDADFLVFTKKGLDAVKQQLGSKA